MTVTNFGALASNTLVHRHPANRALYSKMAGPRGIRVPEPRRLLLEQVAWLGEQAAMAE
ncbi:hypothetical protein [Cohnella sp. OV330]|uniref:hypothetical protein n=1 Tax=Cohnella sp. OV330 TaxID=1855288 RepID=UPI001314B117|nr:hypothetical protein [Cohnella sp. OV330]